MSENYESQGVEDIPKKPNRRQQYITNLLNEVTDPIHQRLIEAYKNISAEDDAVEMLESELAKIFLEILDDEG